MEILITPGNHDGFVESIFDRDVMRWGALDEACQLLRDAGFAPCTIVLDDDE